MVVGGLYLARHLFTLFELPALRALIELLALLALLVLLAFLVFLGGHVMIDFTENPKKVNH